MKAQTSKGTDSFETADSYRCNGTSRKDVTASDLIKANLCFKKKESVTRNLGVYTLHLVFSCNLA